MRTPVCPTVRRGVALLTAAVLTFLFLPITATAYERPTSATATVLTLPSSLTATLAISGATTVSLASPSTIGTHGYRVGDFQPDLGATTPAFELETSFAGCLVATSTCAGLGSLTITFSRPMNNPTLHIAGLGDNFTVAGTSTNFHAILTVTTPGVTLSKAAGPELSVNATTITTVNDNVSSSCSSSGTDGATTPAGCGSVRLNGTGITAVSFDVSGRTFRAIGTGTGTLPSGARDAFTISVTADQDYGDAPATYEGSNAARHLVSDLRLGSGFTTENNNFPNGTISPNAGPGANGDSDDAIPTGFPNGVVGATTTYTRTIPLSGVSQTGRLCGWVDFDRDSLFEPSEQDCQTVTSGQTAATFTVTGTPASAGASYARFRLGYTAAQVESPVGPADSGEVEDYLINFVSGTPALSLTKSANRTSTNTVGQITTYTFTATNTGTVPINNVTITDPKPGMSPLTCSPAQPANLAPGAVLSCTATRATTQADLNTGGVIANTAIANGSTPGGPVSSPPAIAHVQAQQQPAIAIVKSASPTSFTAPGQTLTYTLTVTNTGNVPLSNTQVTDPRLTGLSCTPGQGSTMNPGATKTCTGTYQTTQADVDLGGVNNTASVSGTPPSAGPNATDVDNLFTPGPPRSPDLSLIKTANPTSYTGPGETITYTFFATNTGNVTLTGVEISDPKPGMSPLACSPIQPATLAPGASLNCTATRTTTQDDVNAGSVTNNATVNGSPPSGPPISRFGSVIVAGPTRAPAIDLVKTAAPTTVSVPGEVVTYTLVAQNTGNVTLNGVTVTDTTPGVSPLNCSPAQPTVLAPGATISCTATRTTTQADINAGMIGNTASATGNSPTGAVFDTGSATVTATRNGAVSLVKTASPASYTAVGDTINYTLTATNTGNTTLSHMVITDPMPGLSALSCSPGQPANRDPGESLVCTATLTITQAHLDAGQVGNTATVNALSPGSQPVSATGSAQVSGVQTRSLSLAKSATPATVTAAGQAVNYAFVATNTGNTTLQNVTVADPLPGLSPLSCTPAQPATLAPGNTLSCSANYTATQADLNAAGISNTATVRSEGPGGDPTNPSDDVTASDSETIPSPDDLDIALTKTATPTTVTNAGDVVTYTFAASNTGNVTLNSVMITDPMPGLSGLVCTPGQPALLDPGTTMTCTASYTTTQADIDAGEVPNTATATANSPLGASVTDDDSAMVTAPADPQLVLSKVPSRTTVDAAGQVVDYTFLVSNTGNVSLSNVVIDDPRSGLSLLACTPAQPATLQPDEILTCTASYTTTQADIDAGGVPNTATATGTPPTGADVTDTATVNVPAQVDPEITLDKSASPMAVSEAGQPVFYTFVATNTGNVTLTDVLVDDPLPDLSALSCDRLPPATLAPDEAMTCTASRSTTQADMDAGAIVNTATVAGEAPNGDTHDSADDVTDSDDAVVTTTAAPGIDLEKTANPVFVDSAGDVVTYTYVASNTGNVSLNNVVVTDPLEGVSALNCDRAAPVRLAPGDVLTCTATYSVTQADLDFGSILNTAVVRGEPPGGNPQDPDDDTVDIDDAVVTTTTDASIELAKTADAVEIDEVGEQVTYTLVAANTGSVTLAGVEINDPLPGLSALTCDAPAPVALAPNDELTCTATYQTTQADLDAGVIDNRATVAAEAPGGDMGDPADDVTAEDDEQVTVEQRPEISLANDADPTTIGSAGEEVTFRLVATNIGNVTLTGVEIEADLPGLTPLVCDQPATLTAGETLSCEATYVATQADADAGQIANVATVTATAAGEDDAVTDVDAAVVTVGAAAGIELVKTATGPNTVRVGEVVSYQLRASNTGGVALTEVAITDPLGGLSELECDRAQPARLEPEESVVCRADYFLTQIDLNRGELANTASVIGHPAGDGEPVGDDDSLVIDLLGNPAIGLVKTVDDDSVRTGDVVTYTLAATNLGDLTLSGVRVDDPLPGLSALHCDPTAPAELAPGASLTCSATYRATTADAERGEVVNTATVAGAVANGDATVTATAGVGVEVQPAASIHRPAFLRLADTGGPSLVGLVVAGLLTLGSVTVFVAAHWRRR